MNNIAKALIGGSKVPDIEAGSRIFSTVQTTTWAVERGISSIKVDGIGGGGGGSGGSTTYYRGSAGNPGISGKYASTVKIKVKAGDMLTITVGSGGAGGSVGAAGRSGTSSIVRLNGDIILTANYGNGGTSVGSSISTEKNPARPQNVYSTLPGTGSIYGRGGTGGRGYNISLGDPGGSGQSGVIRISWNE